jgi:polygalacturonase
VRRAIVLFVAAALGACTTEAAQSSDPIAEGPNAEVPSTPPTTSGGENTPTPPLPERVCDVKEHGATGDGKTKDTKAIQAAIDACATTGGKVSLHDGTFLSAMLTLKSNITLDIAPTATLLGSQNVAEYPDTNPPFTNTQLGNCRRALVYAEGAKNVRIQGGGTINGNARGVGDWNGNKIKEALRPMAIFLTASENVVVENVTVKDAATWAVVLMEVEHAVVRGLTVSTDLGPTHDGIDIVDGHDVLIENSTVTSGDDSICLKSGSAKGTKHVVVKNCQTKQSGVANGVKFGTASVGSFEDIVIEDVSIANAQAAAMAVESVDGAKISNVTFRRITTDNVGTPFFVLLGSRDRNPKRVGSIDGVTFEKIKGTNMRYPWGSVITGTTIGNETFDIANISFKDVDLTFKGAGIPSNPAPFTTESFPEYQGPVLGQPGKLYNQYPDAKFLTGFDGREDTAYRAPGYAFFVRHANNVTFAGCKTSVSGSDPRPAIATKDASSVAGACIP